MAACATNPATGKKEISLMSESQEIALGQQMDAEVRREMGVYDDPELQRYVESVGMKLARASQRPELPWHFTVVDEPAVNAFALPGGYIYVTRGILPFLNDEAQLAGVLGHEVGHVTARHSAQQYTKAHERRRRSRAARHFRSRDAAAAERRRDRSGRALPEVRTRRRGAGRSARAWTTRPKPDGTRAGVAGMLTTLSRLDEASGSRRGVPNWLSTHPAPADRVAQVQPYIQKAAIPVGTSGTTDTNDFIRHVDGIVFGDSPSDGIVRGNQFLHPDLRLALAFPPGWEIQNSPIQVTAKAPERDHYMLLQLVQNARGSVDQIAQTGMASAGFRQLNGQRAQINGMDAYVGTYQGNLEGLGNVVTSAAHIVHEKNVYLLAGFSPPNQFDAAQREFAASIRSFRELSREEAAGIRPNRVDVYTVRSGDTWQSIAQRTGDGTVKPATLAIMNNSEPSQQPRAGDRIKVVVTG